MANESLPPPELLESAAKLIERAAAQMDARRYACLECGRGAYVSTSEGKAHERLANMPNKLRQVAARLRTGAWPDQEEE